MFIRAVVILLMGFLILVNTQAAGGGETSKRPAPRSSKGPATYEKDVQPLLSQYCYSCHGEKKKGDLDLRIYTDETSILKDRKVWEKLLQNVRVGEMPPAKKPQPTQAERDLIANWVESEVFKCDCKHPDPGRVTIHRLNRAEYNNTIRDLVGVNFLPADDFPADDVGYGFDNIGDVLSLPPILLEKYLKAAQKIVALAFDTNSTAAVKKFNAADLESTADGGPYGNGGRMLAKEGEVIAPYKFEREGEYVLRARAFGQQAGPDPARMSFRLDGKEIKVFDVKAVESAPEIYEVRLPIAAGAKKFAAAYINNYVNPKDPNPDNRDRNLIVDYLEIAGPLEIQSPPLPESYRRIMICQPTPANKWECAYNILANFARRAYRRPVSSEEVNRLLKLVALVEREGESFEKGIQLALQAVLVSPHFLFRGEFGREPENATVPVARVGVPPNESGPRKVSARTPKPAGGMPALPNQSAVYPLSDYELASRLSYFLWSSLPDEELFSLAAKGTLRKNLETQVQRMLRDPKSNALVENFAGQWLELRKLKTATPAAKMFPDFDEKLRAAMQKETELFFETIVREDRSVLDFLNADFTFVNERLARHYGIPDMTGDQFQRVSLKGTQRGGLLTQGSILTVTSNPTRTSPVKRGKWVLENILGTPPPPPPPEVPELKEGKEAVLTGSLRQRMEQHRANPSCASCHARMDPIGFGFENFDGIGAWREKDGDFPIEPAGTLVSGESFQGPADLKSILLSKKKNEFVRCLTEKMLTYALGRGLEYYDKCAVDEISKNLAKKKYKFSSLILEVVRSTPFQKKRGEEGQIE